MALVPGLFGVGTGRVRVSAPDFKTSKPIDLPHKESFALEAAPPTGPNPRRALLVGVGAYDHADLKPLKFTGNDVAELGTLLEANGYDVTTLSDATGAKPTKKNVDAALRKVLDDCKRGDTVLVGLAGHGLQFDGDDDAYFCPSDAKPVKSRAAETMVSMKALYDEMKGSHAGVKVLLVDACRDDPKSGRNIDPESVRPPAGVAALFSCKAGERAYETEKLGKGGHGVFFHHVIEGLKGEAGNKSRRGDVRVPGRPRPERRRDRRTQGHRRRGQAAAEYEGRPRGGVAGAGQTGEVTPADGRGQSIARAGVAPLPARHFTRPKVDQTRPFGTSLPSGTGFAYSHIPNQFRIAPGRTCIEFSQELN